MSQVPPCREMPLELPVLPMREFVLFPYMVLPLFVARDRSVVAVEDALAGDRLILLTAQRDPKVEDPTPEQLHAIGTVAMVMRSMRLPDGRLKVLVQGLSRARVESVIEHEASTWVRVEHLPTEELDQWSVESEALIRTVRSRVEELLPLKNLPPEVLSIIAGVDKPGRLADLVASNLRLRIEEAQDILEISDPIAKLRRVDAVLRTELDVSSMQAEIQTQAREELSRGQREVFLREQLRAIQSELGEIDPRGEEADEFRYRIEEADLPNEAYEEAVRQLRRLERMHPDGPEAQVVRNYLDWICDLPWDRCSPDRLDLDHAREILDADHAHLDGVKERMLEFLGVRKLREDSRGPILCLSGPPGVGKTSLGRSIARAMGREFVRVSLGGVRDEAEIRGHRRTYVGALPGRIIQAMKQAGTSNPVIMLDEIDKLGADFRGDPADGFEHVDGRIAPPLGNRPVKHDMAVQNATQDIGDRFIHVGARDKDAEKRSNVAGALQAGPGTFAKRHDQMRRRSREPAQGRQFANRGGDFAMRFSEARNRIGQEQHMPAGIAKMLSHGHRGPCTAPAHQRRAVRRRGDDD